VAGDGREQKDQTPFGMEAGMASSQRQESFATVSFRVGQLCDFGHTVRCDPLRAPVDIDTTGNQLQKPTTLDVNCNRNTIER
jgi:hypothetical protein